MKEKLLKLRAELQALASTTDDAADIVKLDQSKVGRLSRMDALQGQAMAQEAVRRRDAALRNIAAALQRIEDGEYGRCLICDEAINPKRLDVDPTALHCIKCASEIEDS